ncbi:hypothetical protein C8R43DRAFT_899073 [Mycena crocata]|nr:hypothetical protein C8R43DRAFT_899073 [Mycena crocata]
MHFSTIIATLIPLFLATATQATPAGVAPLDVFVPHITSPTEGEVWVSKTEQTITWRVHCLDTTNAPQNISNGALLQLRKGDITAPFILAKDFDLRAGSLAITVPWVLSDTDYSIVLFGDSGNVSPTFTIQSDTPGPVKSN